ncbi:hypothetical protein G3T14_10105 [Methylobacterium sp. BTF04]|uniref:hypothetical protein n=1 Tax=Methylobacterium sp. BTF04 TaxID=2708300 RepID=UPI0013D571EE|nr:hypothetical protein [Methylobacterium sp. BTF04]NEU12487.1 hypothetical protein [Methylobacterium sp. BTF04]
MDEIARRLDRQDRVLGAILAALAPPEAETEGAAYDDLVEVLCDLTVAVADVTAAIQALRSDGSGRFQPVEP